jgi:hypothetical protein
MPVRTESEELKQASARSRGPSPADNAAGRSAKVFPPREVRVDVRLVWDVAETHLVAW